MATIIIDDIQRDLLGYRQRMEDGETMLIVRLVHHAGREIASAFSG